MIASTVSSGIYGVDPYIATTSADEGLREEFLCTKSFSGTSASTAIATGIYALVLEANPSLTWRDVQYLTVLTSRIDPVRNLEWTTNAVGRRGFFYIHIHLFNVTVHYHK